LNAAVAEPVLDKAKVGAGVEEMCGDRVLENVEVPLPLRKLRELAILFIR
jgi:hypothetical protein